MLRKSLTDQHNDTLAGGMPLLANPDVFNLPIKSIASKAANSIDPDQTESIICKNISKMFQQKTKQTSFMCVFSALEVLFISKM